VTYRKIYRKIYAFTYSFFILCIEFPDWFVTAVAITYLIAQYFKLIYYTDSRYKVYKDKLQNCSCNQFHCNQVETNSMTNNRGGNNGSEK